jgi:hypothetical protein
VSDLNYLLKGNVDANALNTFFCCMTSFCKHMNVEFCGKLLHFYKTLDMNNCIIRRRAYTQQFFIAICH